MGEKGAEGLHIKSNSIFGQTMMEGREGGTSGRELPRQTDEDQDCESMKQHYSKESQVKACRANKHIATRAKNEETDTWQHNAAAAARGWNGGAGAGARLVAGGGWRMGDGGRSGQALNIIQRSDREVAEKRQSSS